MITRNLLKVTACTALGLAMMVSCSKNDDMPEANRSELPGANENFQYMGTTPEIGTLGRVLFYDKALSINDAVACESCHKQSSAFADNKRFSDGFLSEKTTRNTPPIQNLGNSFFIDFPGGMEEGGGQALFWDGRTRVLEQMVLEPVSNHIEMGMRSPTDLIARLGQHGYYAPLFEAAYGDGEITLPRISTALASFLRSFQSNNSVFHQQMFGFGQQLMTPLQQEGFNLFNEKYDCMACHDIVSEHGYIEPVGEEFTNIGLDSDYIDQGVGALTGNAVDNGKFRIPNLRNIALTAPYMHDGRFATLEEVIGHYNNSIQSHPNLDDRLKDISGQPMKMNISPEESEALVAFLHALTDQSFTRDPRFSDPFK